MELRHMRYFAMVAAEQSFSRAAEKLHMAQPPLSRQIRQLEEELGVALLERGRPMTLTEAGRYFYEQMRQVLVRIDEVKTTTRRIGEDSIRHFNIGFVGSTICGGLPELVRKFKVSAPAVEVVLQEMTTIEQAAALLDGRLDVGFGRLRIDFGGISRTVISEEKVVVALPNRHPLRLRTAPLHLTDLVEEPLIIYPRAPRPSYADQVLSFYRDRGIEPKIAFEVRELHTALGLVAADVGISIVPSSVCRLGRNDITYLDLDEPTLVSPIVISTRTNDTSPLLAHFRQLSETVEEWTRNTRSGAVLIPSGM